jgi:hypothetical protein
LTEERRTPGPGEQAQADAQVEDLARQLANVINSAGVESRQDLREYALGLLKEETEVTDAPALRPSPGKQAAGSNAIAVALVLGLASLPLMLFPGVGVTVLGLAILMGLWGAVTTILPTRPRKPS